MRTTRVAIVGGGCAAMTAALELSDPKHAGRFEVTVYQLGFRLGGKGASGRGRYDRVEEHGLHLWFGFYENAFRMMRRVYEELGRDPARVPIATWKDAFFAAPHTGLGHRLASGDWRIGSVRYPALPGEPGDDARTAEVGPLTLSEVMVRALRVVTVNCRQTLGLQPIRAPAASSALDLLIQAEAVLGAVATDLGAPGWMPSCS